MNLYLLPHAIALFAAALLALFSASIAVRRRDAPGAISLALLMLSIAVWTIPAGLEHLSLEIPWILFWAKVEYIGIVNVAPLFLIFALTYSDATQWLKPHLLAWLWIVPVITVAIAFTNELHGWLWSDIVRLDDVAGHVVFEHGWAFWVAAAYNYLLLLVGVLYIVRALVRSGEIFRQQGVATLLSVAFPWISNIIYLSGWNPIPGLDLTPFGFLITGFLLEWNLFGFRLFDLVPVARSTLIEIMSDGVLVLDTKNRIVDFNRSAAMLLALPVTPKVGQRLEAVCATQPALAEQLCDVNITQTQLMLDQPSTRILDVRVSPVYNHQKRVTGRLIIVRDVTDHRQMEEALRDANLHLQTQLGEIEILHATVREQAVRDPLTGLFNRRYLEESLQREIAWAKREQLPLSLVIMDIDHFKNLNDTYGHKAGDLMLRALGEILLEHTRRGDVACRYGGEEFVVALPRAALEHACRRAEEWRAEFEKIAIPYNDNTLRATLSIGVAAFPMHGDSAESVLHMADQALYLAKAEGRNRVKMLPSLYEELREKQSTQR